jgi:hypothetical protein
LTGPITEISTSATVSNTTGMPDGSNGPFAAVIGKGTASEEKVLVGSASGGTVTFAQRGYDGTPALPHSADEELRLVITSIDAQEANAHVNATTGAHGLAVTDSFAGINAVQAFTNKTIDGEANNIINIDPADSPLIGGLVTAEAAARVAGDALRYSKTEADALFATQVGATAYTDEELLEHTEALDPHIQYLKKTAQGFLQADDLPLDIRSDSFLADTTDSIAATDALPVKQLGSLNLSDLGVVSHTGPTYFQVSFLWRGVTSNGSGGDICRYKVYLGEATLLEWVGYPAGAMDYPTQQFAIDGDTSVPRNGGQISAIARMPQGQVPVDVPIYLEKISGNPNPTILEGVVTGHLLVM